MSDLSISLLGPFEVTLAQRPLTSFRTKSVQALLIYLVCETDHPHQREALMELLWPGMPAASAQANMRQTLYRLRQLIPEVMAKEGDYLAARSWIEEERSLKEQLMGDASRVWYFMPLGELNSRLGGCNPQNYPRPTPTC